MDYGIVFEENRMENAKKKKNDVDHSKLMKNLASIKKSINDAGFEHDDVPSKVFAHIKEAHQSIHNAINALTPHMKNGDDMHPSDVDVDDPRKEKNRKDPAEELDAIGFPPKKKEQNAEPKHKEGDGVVYGDDNATVLHVIPGSPNKYEIKIAGGDTVTVREDQLA